MPFLLDGNPTQGEIAESINYLLANFSANLSSDPNTGQITGSNNQIIGYLYKYMMVKYADNFDGTVGFSNTQTNKSYYGLRNSNSSIESTNPADYIWYQATGGFGTTKTLYYKVTGGRSIDFQIATSSPGYAWVPDTGAAIDLDALTMAFTVNAIIYKWGTSTTPSRPTTSTTYTWSTNSYTAPSGWSTSVPSGGSPGDYLWSITIMVTQTGGIETSVLDWTNTGYPIVAVGINGQDGQNGTSNIVAYLVQSQASPTPAFSSTTTGPNAPSGWSLATPAVAVGQVLWYIQGQYNSSTTDTINGVAPNTTAWTGPIAASIFQDIRSDNWNGGNPPTAGNPSTYGTQGYYIERTSGSVYLNNVYARNYIEVGGAASDVNSGVTTVSGGKITANSITASQIASNTITASQIAANTITAAQIAANTITATQLSASYIVVGGAAGDVNAGTTTINGGKITANSITVNEINNVATGQIIAGSFNFVPITSSTTWTVPAYVYKVKITLTGGGGGGFLITGGGVATIAGGGGGGGGALIKVIPVVPGDSYSITIGSGGSGSSSPTAGGASIFSGHGTTLTANGGGVSYVTYGTLVRSTGGTATGGDLNYQGSGGPASGEGGASPFVSSLAAPGVTASPNSGAGGGYNQSVLGSAGNGADGICILEY